MRSTTNFRRTRILVTKIIRLTIETGSVTGIYPAPSVVINTITLLLAVVALLNFVLIMAFPHQTSYMTPGVLIPKLYANTVYMVLNSPIPNYRWKGYLYVLQPTRASRT